MELDNKRLVARTLEIAESLASLEGLSPPDVTVVVVDNIYKPRLRLMDGLDVDLVGNTILIEKSTPDNILYRVLVGVFFLSYWHTFKASNPAMAQELARKHFFKALVALFKDHP
ncbi:hypothetical protein IG193_05285 [Infirmifilum lucidum]|uniref:Uncharacterized protein n=1 Tax=Infirmifilum lucidum TaxID=2776706 RepID=A0A7L9FGZ9_9CREN|nr:hypothetical protein [Infirmifilum lucidum]QOJ78196.1 hypothetical protein IG193_05285 [Infirmifilum lucidum]